MKRMLMAVLAVALAVTFSAPAFAGDDGKKKEEGKKGKVTQMVYGDDGKKKEEVKKGK